MGRSRYCLPLLAALCSIALPAGSVLARDLTFEERVRAQEAIDRVYYAHQAGATISFEKAVPREAIEAKVRASLEQSIALERDWRTPLTGDMLERELDRMASSTRYPDRLAELAGALRNDPFLLAECQARPALASRLSRSFFDRDRRIHARTRAEAESLRAALLRGAAVPQAASFDRRIVELRRTAGPEGTAGELRPDSGPGAEDLSAGAARGSIPGSGAAGVVELGTGEFDRRRAKLPTKAGEPGPVEEETFALVVRLDGEPDDRLGG